MFFSKLGKELYDIIGSPERNNVGHAADQLFGKGYASGGIVGDESGTKLTDNDPLGVNSSIKQAGNNLTKSVSNTANNYDRAFKEQMTITHFIHNNFGSFFKPSDTGGTNEKMKTPMPTKSNTAVDPSEFYAKWYNAMRQFAEASEVASRGQTKVQSR